MVNKRTVVIMTLVIGLCGCANNPAKNDENINISCSEKSVEWEGEHTYALVDTLDSKDGISIDNLLLMSMIPQSDSYSMDTQEIDGWNDYFINYSMCFVFQDGFVYCANEPFFKDIEQEAYCIKYDDEMWNHFNNVYYVGRLSFEETNQLKEWIDKIDLTCEYTTYDLKNSYIETHPIDMRIFRKDLPQEGGNIWKANYKLRTSFADPIEQDGTLFLDDMESQQIIKWFEESLFCDSWNRHMEETVTCMEYETVTPCLTEDEIMNLSDDDLLYYGGLAKHKLLNNVDMLYEVKEEFKIPDFAICNQYCDSICIGVFVNTEESGNVINRYYISCLNEAVKISDGWGIAENTSENQSPLFAGLWKDSWKISEEGGVLMNEEPDLIKQLQFKNYNDPESEVIFITAQ